MRHCHQCIHHYYHLAGNSLLGRIMVLLITACTGALWVNLIIVLELPSCISPADT